MQRALKSGYWCLRIGFAQSEKEKVILLHVVPTYLVTNLLKFSLAQTTNINSNACTVFSSVILPIVMQSKNNSAPEIVVESSYKS